MNNTEYNPGNDDFIVEDAYGMHNGEAIRSYTLRNLSGMQVTILNYGATVTSITVTDKYGIAGDVVLGYISLQGYLQPENPYLGCIAGRYANRIANAKFSLNGEAYNLSANNNGHALHGGNKGFDKVVWKAELIKENSALRLTYNSKDGEEGYPGNLLVSVTYQLTPENALKIDYSATTDKATPVNLTSHCYFNLSAGNDPTILDHELQINASSFTEVDEALIPTGQLIPVNNTAMDFTSFKKVGQDMTKVNGGYDHNWIINKKPHELVLAATLQHAASGRCMEVYTTQPGIQFYSGNFLDGSLQHTKNKEQYGRHGGLCLETQNFPDAPNHLNFPDSILKPNEQYQHTTLYKFLINP